jgi:secondary thiamine-phosphate synthase enzyme
MMKELSIRTSSHAELIDITGKVQSFIKDAKLVDGVVTVYVPHTTAGVTINENADPSVKADILMELDKNIPLNDNYSHLEGNSAAHIKASLMGPSVTVIVEAGRLVLGTWQGIFFCEFDGPRNRKCLLKTIASGVD